MTSHVPVEKRAAVTIRPASVDDVSQIVAMVNDAYRVSEGHVFPTTTRTGRTDALRDIEGIVVAEIDGRIAGCIHLDVTGAPAHFGMLATDVAVQGRGVASALIEYAESAALGRAVMRIEAIREGGKVPFYERRGYVVARERDGQEWNGGKDWGAVIPWHMVEMEKQLR